MTAAESEEARWAWIAFLLADLLISTGAMNHLEALPGLRAHLASHEPETSIHGAA